MNPAPTRSDLLQALVSPASDSALEALMDTQPGLAFYIKDLRGRYVLVNEVLRERTGFKLKRDLVGRTAAELFTGDPARVPVEQALLEGKELRGVLEFYMTGGGQPIWCLTDNIPLRGPSGAVIGLVGLSRDLPRASQHSEFPKVAQALGYIHAHFLEDVRLRDIAAEVGLSVDSLERRVKRVTGLTPKQLLLRARFEYAARLLRQTRRSISDIAHTCGYSDHSAFSRKFRAMAGITPQGYRQTFFESSAAMDAAAPRPPE